MYQVERVNMRYTDSCVIIVDYYVIAREYTKAKKENPRRYTLQVSILFVQ